MAITIRDFQQADFANGLLECLCALAETVFESDSNITFGKLRRQGRIRTFVAVDGDRVVGTASLLLEHKFLHGGAWFGHIEDVVVHPDRQGEGIGLDLVKHAISVCRDADAYKVVLNCSDANVPFYEKAGFRRHDNGMRLDLEV